MEVGIGILISSDTNVTFFIFNLDLIYWKTSKYCDNVYRKNVINTDKKFQAWLQILYKPKKIPMKFLFALMRFHNPLGSFTSALVHFYCLLSNKLWP